MYSNLLGAHTIILSIFMPVTASIVDWSDYNKFVNNFNIVSPKAKGTWKVSVIYNLCTFLFYRKWRQRTS